MKNTSCKLKIQSASEEIREFVKEKMRGATLAMVYGLFQQEIDQLCGQQFCRKGDKLAHRAGSDPGSILANGQRLAVKKPRAKLAGKELELKTYASLQDYDILSERVLSQMLAGVSTRDYGAVLEEISGGMGLSKSAVSETFVRTSKGALDAMNARDLSKYRFAAIMIDGVTFGDRVVIVAMGITTTGEKLVMGLREGETENWEIARDLLESLIARGLIYDQPILFIIDGGKALRKAINKLFGSAPVQRCVRHKERNILAYLPKERHLEFHRRWKKLHTMTDHAVALRECGDLLHWLGGINTSAQESLKEAAQETLTVIKLKVAPILCATLLSTNPIESMFSIQKAKLRRVKNWRSGPSQVMRWAATSLMDAEQRFHRVAGYLHLPRLMETLKIYSIEKQTDVA